MENEKKEGTSKNDVNNVEFSAKESKLITLALLAAKSNTETKFLEIEKKTIDSSFKNPDEKGIAMREEMYNSLLEKIIGSSNKSYADDLRRIMSTFND